MGITTYIAIKQWVQNLEEVDIVFRRTLTLKYTLPTNIFC